MWSPSDIAGVTLECLPSIDLVWPSGLIATTKNLAYRFTDHPKWAALAESAEETGSLFRRFFIVHLPTGTVVCAIAGPGQEIFTLLERWVHWLQTPHSETELPSLGPFLTQELVSAMLIWRAAADPDLWYWEDYVERWLWRKATGRPNPWAHDTLCLNVQYLLRPGPET